MLLSLWRQLLLVLSRRKFGDTIDAAIDYGENNSIYQIDEKEEIGGLGVLLGF